MIKFYNPFKPHIVEDGFGKYWIRRLSILGWNYYDKDDKKFWFVKAFGDSFGSLYEAMMELQNAKENLKRNKERDRVL